MGSLFLISLKMYTTCRRIQWVFRNSTNEY